MNPTPKDAKVTTIDFDEKKQRFIVSAPSWMIDLCRQIPNRRWDVRRRVWTAPAIRANADFFSRSLDTFQGTFTPAAQAKVTEVLSRAREAHQRGNFPVTFRFRTKPMAHQSRGLDQLYGLHAMAWFMDMGTGKTFQVINVHAALMADGRCDTVLVMCPNSLRRNWQRQLATHMPEWNRYTVHLLETDKKGLRAYQDWLAESVADLADPNPLARAQRWMIIGLESMSGSKTIGECAMRYLCSSTKSATVVDEAHLIKNSSSIRTKTACTLGRSSEYRTIMTGTPISQSPLDLYAMFEFLDPDIIGMGDYYSFRSEYAIMGGYENKEILGFQKLPELVEIIAPFTYQARKRDVLDLPPKTYEVRELQMTDEQKRLYTTMRRARMVATGDKSLFVQNVLEKMLRLQEIVGGFVSYENEFDTDAVGKKLKRTYREAIAGPNPKVTEILNILAESDQSVIIWCVYSDEIRAVEHALKQHGISVCVLHGKIDEETRQQNIDDFQAGKYRVIVANAQTGGAGHDLFKATLEIYYSNSFSLLFREQSEDRAHRIGQTKNVLIIDLQMADTVDVTIMAALQAKLDVSEYVRQAIDDEREEQLYGQ